jgi:hypothetical protein
MVLMGTWSGVQSEAIQMQLTTLATLPCSAGKTRSQFYGEQL